MVRMPLNPISKIPWITAAIFKMDWLHATDQGCAADFLGNAFWAIKDKFPGRSQKERVRGLWEKTVGGTKKQILRRIG